MNGQVDSPPESAFHCTAVIVAAGSGTRMGFDKLLAPLEGLPVLLRSIVALLEAPSIRDVVVVCPSDRWDSLAFSGPSKPVLRVDGGARRQDSVSAGLAALPSSTTHVAIHDGARPLVSTEDIEAVIASARSGGAASLAHPVVDTLKRAGDDGFTSGSVDREQLWAMETPQVFRRDWVSAALDSASFQGITVTDEVSALGTSGHSVRLVPSRFPNPKITTPQDLVIASALIRASS